MPPPDSPIPYQIDQRPMPSGEVVETLLPAQVGPFPRSSIDDYEPDEVRNEFVEAWYSCGEARRKLILPPKPKFLGLFSFPGRISVRVSICDNPEDARKNIDVEQEENAGRPDRQLSLNTEPSFFKCDRSMAWTRANYYFSVLVDEKDAKEILDLFMEAFPY